jgi:AcrR family transcriptional regulator
MFNKKIQQNNRGRPQGRSAKGEQTRLLLYRTSIELFSRQGYEATTLRQIAREAGVSPGLLYKYFPSKVAVVLELYDELSLAFVADAAELPAGTWVERSEEALRRSLDTLRPHRESLRALMPIMVGDPAHGLFADRTAFSRQRVQSVFEQAVSGSRNPPAEKLIAALGNLLYVGHLGAVLWWLLDRSPEQRATAGLIRWTSSIGALVASALWLPGAKTPLLSLDRLIRQGLYGEAV